MGDANDALIESWQLGIHDRTPGTRELYERALRGFVAWLEQGGRADGDLLAVTRQDGEAWFRSMAALAPNTLRTRWVALRSFYSWAVDEDEITDSPMTRVRVPRPQETPPPVLDTEALRRLVKACDGRSFQDRRDAALLRTFLATGARLGEVTALELDDLDLAARLVVIRRGKGGRMRIVRIDGATAASLDRYRRARARHRRADARALWLGTQGPMSAEGVSAALKRRASDAGVAGFHVHLLRHTFAHLWQAKGGSESDLLTLGGWRDASVMRRYGAARQVDRALAHYDDVDLLGDLG